MAVHDPLADAAEARHEYGLNLTPWENLPAADAVVIAVAHDAYRTIGAASLATKLRPMGVVIDVKAVFSAHDFPSVDGYWRL